jgi:hypothetical protein
MVTDNVESTSGIDLVGYRNDNSDTEDKKAAEFDGMTDVVRKRVLSDTFCSPGLKRDSKRCKTSDERETGVTWKDVRVGTGATARPGDWIKIFVNAYDSDGGVVKPMMGTPVSSR